MASAIPLLSGRGRWRAYATYAVTFGLPAALAWAVVGAVFRWVNIVEWAPPTVHLATLEVLAVLYGLAGFLRIAVWVPGTRWQVPADWIAGRSQLGQALVWGTTLGPGFLTLNPYACFWLGFLLLVPISGEIEPRNTVLAAAGLGLIHGAARAAGILLNAKNSENCSILPMEKIRWRVIDNLALLLGAGVLQGILIGRFAI